MFGRGEKGGDLYILSMGNVNKKKYIPHVNEKRMRNVTATNLTDSFQPEFVLTFGNNVSARVWHERLGHLSFERLELLKSQLHCNNPTCTDVDPCYICVAM